MLSRNVNLTEGPLVSTIFRFTVPTVIGALIQTMFNLVDQVVLGQMAGSDAVASVNACTMVTHLVVNLFIGLSVGVTVVLSRAIGAGDFEKAKKITSTALLSAVGLGAFAVALALPFVGVLLDITKCPKECREGAEIYMVIYYCSTPAITLYNFGSAILRVNGDSRHPTYYMIAAGALNAGLNVLLCLVLPQKVAAVAIATLVSQAAGAALTFLQILKLPEERRPSFRPLTFDWSVFAKLMQFGVPSGLASSLYPLSNLQIQAGVNSFGRAATAGFGACATVEEVVASVKKGFDATASAMVGQNLGAKKPERVRKTILLCVGFSFLLSELFGLGVFCFREPIFRLFAPDSEEAVAYAVERTYYLLAIYGVCGIFAVLSGIVNAFGHTALVMATNLCTTLIFRAFWMNLVYPKNPTYGNIILCFTVSWTMNLVLFSLMTAVISIRYRHGHLRKV